MRESDGAHTASRVVVRSCVLAVATFTGAAATQARTAGSAEETTAGGAAASSSSETYCGL